jgi:hypothetical protein
MPFGVAESRAEAAVGLTGSQVSVRNWRQPELAASSDVFRPPNSADLIRALVRDCLPGEPIQIE